MPKPKLLLLTGKGGIGKTTLSALVGLRAAQSGLKCLIVEAGSTPQIAPLFGLHTRLHESVPLCPQLSAIHLENQSNFKDYILKHLGQKMLYEKVLSHQVVQSLIGALPGLAELMILGRLFYECHLKKEDRADLVIFDGPASGHFLSMMTTMDAVLSSQVQGPIRSETERVKEFLRTDSQTWYVSVAEELVVSEALEFIPKLQSSSPSPLGGAIVNRVLASKDVSGTYLTKRHQRENASLERLDQGLKSCSRTLFYEQGFLDEPWKQKGLGSSLDRLTPQEWENLALWT